MSKLTSVRIFRCICGNIDDILATIASTDWACRCDGLLCGCRRFKIG